MNSSVRETTAERAGRRCRNGNEIAQEPYVRGTATTAVMTGSNHNNVDGGLERPSESLSAKSRIDSSGTGHQYRAT